MIGFILETGLQSVALWVGLTVVLFALLIHLRPEATSEPSKSGLDSIRELVHSRLFPVVLGSGVAVNLGYGLYKAYVNPRDIMQDIVSADQFLQGKSLYPPRVNQKMRDLLASEPVLCSGGTSRPAASDHEMDKDELTPTDPRLPPGAGAARSITHTSWETFRSRRCENRNENRSEDNGSESNNDSCGCRQCHPDSRAIRPSACSEEQDSTIPKAGSCKATPCQT